MTVISGCIDCKIRHYNPMLDMVRTINRTQVERQHLSNQSGGGCIMSDPRVMGYARVSSTGQNLARQILELRKYVPEENIIVLCGSIPRIIQHLPIWICRTTCLIISWLISVSRQPSENRHSSDTNHDSHFLFCSIRA